MTALASRPCGFCARSALRRERVRLMPHLGSVVARASRGVFPVRRLNPCVKGTTVLALCSLYALADKPSDRCGIEITALVSSLPGEVPTPLPTLRVAGSQLGIHLSIAFSDWCREHRRGNQHDQSGGE